MKDDFTDIVFGGFDFVEKDKKELIVHKKL